MNLLPPDNVLQILAVGVVMFAVVWGARYSICEMEHRQRLRHTRDSEALRAEWAARLGVAGDVDDEALRQFAICREQGGCTGRA